MVCQRANRGAVPATCNHTRRNMGSHALSSSAPARSLVVPVPQRNVFVLHMAAEIGPDRHRASAGAVGTVWTTWGRPRLPSPLQPKRISGQGRPRTSSRSRRRTPARLPADGAGRADVRCAPGARAAGPLPGTGRPRRHSPGRVPRPMSWYAAVGSWRASRPDASGVPRPSPRSGRARVSASGRRACRAPDARPWPGAARHGRGAPGIRW